MSANFADLLDMDMDSIEDLPPIGVPPTGHYNLLATATTQKRDGGNEYIQITYEVTSINELKNEAEAPQAAVGMKFSDFFSPLKKDGTANTEGMKYLKAALAPFAAHFSGARKFADLLTEINNVAIATTLTRTADKQDPDRFKFRLADTIVL